MSPLPRAVLLPGMYPRLSALLLAAAVSVSVFAPPAVAIEPANLEPHKKELTRYIESGEYGTGIARVALQASKYVAKRAARAKPGQKLAIVFDIDETVLSNLTLMQSYGFGYNPKVWSEWIAEARAPAILPVQTVYETAVRHGVAVFFVTARTEPQRSATERNLRTVGYDSYANAFFRRPEDLRTTRQYKTAIRTEIESAGYTIIANVGDQESDLLGGHAERFFKLPNPFYIVY